MTIKQYIKTNKSYADYEIEDTNTIIRICAKHGIDTTFEEAYKLWCWHSNDYCAGWLGIGETSDEDYIFDIIIDTAKEMYKDELEEGEE